AAAVGGVGGGAGSGQSRARAAARAGAMDPAPGAGAGAADASSPGTARAPTAAGASPQPRVRGAPPGGVWWGCGRGPLAMGPGRVSPLGHRPVDAELAAPTGGGTGAAHPCGDGLGAPLEEALRAEAPGLGHGRIAHAPRGADTGSIRRLEGDAPFYGLTR